MFWLDKDSPEDEIDSIEIREEVARLLAANILQIKTQFAEQLKDLGLTYGEVVDCIDKRISLETLGTGGVNDIIRAILVEEIEQAIANTSSKRSSTP